MAVFDQLTIPDEGVALLTSVIATQGTLTVTEMRFSDIDYTGQEHTITAATWAGTFQTVTPSASVHDTTTINVTGSFTNAGYSSDKTLKTVGIVGEDSNGVPTLIGVAVATSYDVIPQQYITPSTFTYSANIVVSSTADIHVSGSQAGALFVADIIDNLTSQDTDKPLSANQGYVLKGLIDNVSANADEESIVTVLGELVDYGNKLAETAEYTTAADLSDFTNGWHFIPGDSATLDYNQLPVTAADIGVNPSWLHIIKDTANQTYTAEYVLNNGTQSKWVLPIQPYSPAPTSSSWTKVGGPVWPTFATATDEEIASMVALADAGRLDLYHDCGWRVGQEHQITLGSIAASGTYDGVSWTVGEAQASQTVTLVLLHRGLYELVSPTASGRTTCSFVVGIKETLATSGYMNSTATNTGVWEGSQRRSWCNGGFRGAIPSALRGAFKQFKTTTAQTYNGSTNIVSQDYFALTAATELLGKNTQYTVINAAEEAALTPFTYYETVANRIKQRQGTSTDVVFWLRSASSANSQIFCLGSTTGGLTVGYANAGNDIYLSPFGCI